VIVALPAWTLYAAALGAAALVAALAWSRVEIVGLERDVARCEVEKKDLGAAIDKQNEAVAALARQSAAAVAASASAAAAAATAHQERAKLAEDLQTLIRRPKATACAPAIAEIRRRLQR
jgi:hypothetical protein